MESLAVVESIDGVADQASGEGELCGWLALEALVLERREEALGDGVVPAVALAAHAAHGAREAKDIDVLVGGIRTARSE